MDKIKITQEVSMEKVQDLLCNALEGGGNYWYFIKSFNYPKRETKESLNIRFQHIELPFKGGSLTIQDISGEGSEQKDMILDLTSILEGLQIMADKFPKHFMDFICENDDAETGDVFLQCCLFKDVIYG